MDLVAAVVVEVQFLTQEFLLHQIQLTPLVLVQGVFLIQMAGLEVKVKTAIILNLGHQFLL